MNVSTSITTPRSPCRALAAIAAACGAIGVIGLVLSPKATWSGYLLGFALFSGLSLAGPLFIAVHH